MRRFTKLPPWQSVGLVAAIGFGVYLIVAVTVQARGGNQNSLSGFAGVIAWIVLIAAVVLYLNAWRRRPNAPERMVTAFLEGNRIVADTLGLPVRVTLPERIAKGTAANGVQMPVTAVVRGPLGESTAHLTLARVSGAWEVLHAELDRDGNSVPLATGK
jgi:hypothetical protein